MQKLIELEVEGKQVVLYPGTTMAMEWNNPLFAEDVVPGSLSMPFEIPAEPNGVVFGFPELVANTADIRRDFSCVIRSEGEEIAGLLKLRKVTNIRYSVNVQFGYSAFGSSLKSRSIRDFEYSGDIKLGNSVKEVCDHMLDTAKHPEKYDYVFAPVYNPGFFGDDAQYFAGLVNEFMLHQGYQLYTPGFGEPWYDLDGEPVYACFVYKQDFGGGAFPGFSGPYVRGICPFPNLKYVMQQIVQELGVELQESFFDEELEKLYVLSNANVDSWTFEVDPVTGESKKLYKFRVADVLPDIPFSQVLKELKGTFALSVQVGLDKKVNIKKISDILAADQYLDLTAFAHPEHEREVQEAKPMTLTYRLSDDLASERVKGFDEKDLKLKEPVATTDNLPVEAENGEVRLVQNVNQYYRFSTREEPFGWGFYSDNYAPVKLAGGGESIEQGIPLTVDYFYQYNANNIIDTLKMPGMNIASFQGGGGKEMDSLRLAFYRGFQGIKENVPEKIYPLLSGDDLNAKGEAVGSTSLKLDGENGTYNKYLKEWLDLAVNPKPLVKPLWLDMPTLMKIDLNQKVNIDGVRFLIRKLKFTLPLTKAVTAELIQVKK